VSHVYEISNHDSQQALTALLNFFKLKKSNARELFIVPQIVDWMWHEFIVDTRRYTDFCNIYFGRYLHHVKSRYSENARIFLNKRFRITQRTLIESYKIDAKSSFWLDAGWNCPKYRVRNVLAFDQCLKLNPRSISPSVAALDLQWVSQRLAERYGLTVNQSQHALMEYQVYLSGLNPTNNTEVPSNACDAAWKEHILSTVKYHRDCNSVFGTYLHRSQSKALGDDDAA
jgi:hypothetical protein